MQEIFCFFCEGPKTHPVKEKKSEQFSIRFEPSLANEIKKFAATVKLEPKDFIREAIAEMCAMMSDPRKNDLPEIVAMVRHAQEYKRNPIPLTKPRKTA